MKTEIKFQKTEASGQRASSRNVLECGSPLPLFPSPATSSAPPESARGLAQSKTWRSFVTALALLATVMVAQAQYAIDWSKIAGGGGTSTGGVYAVSGTIDQPDAGVTMTSGPVTGTNNYSLTGGFWSLYAVQTPGAPLLAITQAGNQAIVSWDSSVTGWTLQTNKNLATGTWGNYTGAVVNNRVTNSPPTGNLFFRLKQP